MRRATNIVMGVVAPLLFSGCAWIGSTPGAERAAAGERLAAELGRDLIEVLHVIGRAPSKERALELARELSRTLSPDQELRLLRFGLSADDERAVFGAVVLLNTELVPVAELRHAAEIVLPRLADADCPVTTDQAEPLIGPGDFPALVPVIRRLPEQSGAWFLGELHRMVRPGAIPPLCELARTTDGAVRRQAFSDAAMTASYSHQHVPLLVKTWLECVGYESEPDGDGLPGTLRAALRAYLELPAEPAPAKGELDRRLPELPVVSCGRWLIASGPAAVDLPLMRALIAAPARELRAAAVWALGSMRDEGSLELLRGDRPDGAGSACWSAARARRGDRQALESLLSGEFEDLAFGLAVAPPERRRTFFAELLAMEVDDALPIVRMLSDWPRGGISSSFADPPYEDRYIEELEPMIDAAHNVDARLVRAFVGALPCCETVRLADTLLAFPADELFALDTADRYATQGLGSPYLGHGGVWAFLEVTRPQAFRRRMLEGLGSAVPGVRDHCAELLIRIGDTERLEELVTWLDGGGDAHEAWIYLARDRSAQVRDLLRERVRAGNATDPKTAELLPPLAAALGMPFEFAVQWSVPVDDVVAVREALLAGDAARAYLQTAHYFDPWRSALLAAWQPRVAAFLREQREASEGSVKELYQFDQLWALATDDRPALERMMQPVRAGLYATHSGFSGQVAARVEGLAMLPFWIDELGSNCCKAVFVEEVLEDLFGRESGAFGRRGSLEPAGPFLRRTLLPVVDRLRWSRIANGYVVAGR